MTRTEPVVLFSALAAVVGVALCWLLPDAVIPDELIVAIVFVVACAARRYVTPCADMPDAEVLEQARRAVEARRRGTGAAAGVVLALLLAPALAAASEDRACAGNAVWDLQYSALDNAGTRSAAIAWFRAHRCTVRIVAGSATVLIACPQDVDCEGQRGAPPGSAPPATTETTAPVAPGLVNRLLEQLLVQREATIPHVGEPQCTCSASMVDVGQEFTCTARYTAARAAQWEAAGAGRVTSNPAPDQSLSLDYGYSQVSILAERVGDIIVYWSQGRLCREVRVLTPPSLPPAWWENPKVWLTVGAVTGGVIWGATRESDPTSNIPPPGF